MHQALKLPRRKAALLLIDMQEEHRTDTRYLVENCNSQAPRCIGNVAHGACR